jgi:glutamate-5-semialdehyde dehydrogenase
MSISELTAAAKAASIQLAAVSPQMKNRALAEIGKNLKLRSEAIIAANEEDLAKAASDNLAAPLLKRLKFDESKINEVCSGIDALIGLDEPVGQTLSATELDKGLELYKVTCPIGVIGVIFESRPDALVQISTLCLKSSNAVILKGGSEAAHTNRILADIIAESSQSVGVPAGWIQLLETRAAVIEMLKMDKHIDLLVPRGSNEFVQYIMANTNIPVLGHAAGVCHVYVDKAAQIDMAVNIAVDAKCQYCAVCNAMETLLVHKDIADEFLPRIKAALEDRNVEIRGCEKTRDIIEVDAATEEDWSTEYLDYIISVKVVSSLDDAIGHINKYGSKHTDTIVTDDKNAAAAFMNIVDSAGVFWNASTRFSDGYRFGLGAEVGISTNKIHARGPVGLDGLLIYKWKLIGSGNVVADYGGKDGRKFTHKELDKKFEL